MGNYTILQKFENPRGGRQARNFTTNAPKILDLKSSSEQIFSRKLPLGAPERIAHFTDTIGNEAGVDHVLIQRTLHALLCKLCCCSRVVGLFIQKPLQLRAG